MENIINKIKEKKEFSELPDSIIQRILNLKQIKDLDKRNKIKKSRAVLRKLFSAFLTNKILKQKINNEEILKKHYSTKYRNYLKLYKMILNKEKTIIDLGCGVNGFSFQYMLEFKKDIRYVGIEAIGQLVELMNNYFEENRFNAIAIHKDLFNIKKILDIIKQTEMPRIIFMFNIIDALELVERDFSKKFILEIIKECEKIVLSFSIRSLGKRRKFEVKRFWILNFIKDNFIILDKFEINGEQFIVFKKR